MEIHTMIKFLVLGLVFIYCINADKCSKTPLSLYTPMTDIPWQTDPDVKLLFNNLQNRLQNQKQALKLPCLSAVLVFNDEVIWEYSLGYANESQMRKADSNTIYRIASLTKVFTSLLMFQMKQANLIPNFSVTVPSLEPRFSIINPFNDEKITIGQLASHLGGLFGESPCTPSEADCTAEYVYNRTNKESLIFPPNYRPSYSNFGFALLGRALENAFPNKGQTYEEYVKKYILEEMKMTSSGFEFTPEIIKRIALGDGTRSVFLNSGYNNPNGQMYTSANDISKFMISILKSNKFLNGILTSEFMSPVYIFPEGKYAMGYPWEMRLLDKYWVRTKVGNFDGFSSTIAMIPELKVGMAVFNNRGNLWPPSQLTDDAMIDIARTLEKILPKYQNQIIPVDQKKYVGKYTFQGYEFHVLNPESEGKPIRAILNSGGTGTLTWVMGDKFVLNSDMNDTCINTFFQGEEGIAVWFNKNINTGEIISVNLPGTVDYWDMTLIKQK